MYNKHIVRLASSAAKRSCRSLCGGSRRRCKAEDDIKAGEASFASLGSCLPPIPVPVRRRRGRRWWGWWRRWRRRRGRGLEVPSVMVVMAMVNASPRHRRSGRCHCDPGECDCSNCRDEFDLVHGVVPFFVCGYLFLSGCGSDESAYQASDERRSYFAPILCVQGAVVVFVVVLRRVVMPRRRRRRAVHRGRWRWRIVMDNHVSRPMLRRSGVVRVHVRRRFRRM